jgi:hypothetical protein
MGSGAVLTVKVPDVLFAPTNMYIGTFAPLELKSQITIPLEGAGLLRVTVPVADSPPRTLEGLKVMETRAGGEIVKLVV